MKKYGALIALGVAIIFGVLAVFLANQWMTNQVPAEVRTEFKEQLPVTMIVIAATDIPIGTPLTGAVLTKAKWPKANVPKGAFHEIAELEGRVAVSKLTAGTPLLKAELAEAGSGAGLVALIPRGTRAMSIRVDEVIGVAGFILPGTFVDVVHVDTEKKKDVSSIILEKIQVLAIAQEAYAGEEGGKATIVRTVTLLLKPEEATLLALKTRRGSIHLLLRSPLEEKKAEVIAKPKPKAKKRPKPIPVLKSRISSPRPTPHTVEIIRGSERENVRFKHVGSEQIIQ
jgi:pilus assembly protein CpaB